MVVMVLDRGKEDGASVLGSDAFYLCGWPFLCSAQYFFIRADIAFFGAAAGPAPVP
jgi:hypothetical protein